MKLAALVAGLLVALALAAAPSASAHAVRIACDPAEAARLSVGPAQVSATFNERLQTAFPAMTVVGPDGNLWSTGDPRLDGAVISVALRPLGPVGRYTVNYRVTSADGHPVTGSWWFELIVPGSGTPGPAAASATRTGGIGVWPFAAVAAGVLLFAAVWAVRRARRS
ncbi:MAG: copper resistance protein CopC [Mycobacteriaceae bacterium]|nr:copper resistance protein CopC [Mycobacteriaceae bacterium]